MKNRLYFIVLTVLLSIVLSGCGAVQSVSEVTTEIAKAVFTWDIRTLHLDFNSRGELNVDDEFLSSAVVVRIYQLKEKDKFTSATYASLVNNDVDTLGETVLERKEFILKPSSSASIDVPLNKNAAFIGIIALFRDPNLIRDDWRLLVKRGDLNITSPRKIDVNKYHLALLDNK